MKSILNLEIKYCEQTSRSVLKNCYVTAPYKFLTIPNFKINQKGFLYGTLMSASPGVLAKDDFHINIKLAKNSALYFDTQAFNRILSMPENQQGTQYINIECQKNTFLHYLPHPTVLHQDADYAQYTNVILNNNCKILLGDCIVIGRIQHHECYQFRRFFSQTCVYFNNLKILEDKLNWQPSLMNLKNIGQMQDFSHLLNMYFFDTNVILKPTLSEKIYTLLGHLSIPIEYGVSQVHDNSLAIKAVAKDFQDLETVMQLISNFFMDQKSNNGI